MPVSKKKGLEIQRRRALVSDLYMRGKPQHEIAVLCGVDPAQITRDLQAIRADWRASSIRNFDAAKAEQLAKIDRLETEHWRGWDQSWKVAETRIVKTTTEGFDANGKPIPTKTEASKREEDLRGDPRYLAGIAQCVKQRCELLGLITQKHQHSGDPTNRTPIPYVEVDLNDPGDGNKASPA